MAAWQSPEGQGCWWRVECERAVLSAFRSELEFGMEPVLWYDRDQRRTIVRPPHFKLRVGNLLNTRGWWCGNCDHPANWHPDATPLRGAGVVRPCRHCDCPRHESPCGVCDGWSYTANGSRICRPCRRFIRSKERELREIAWARKREQQDWALYQEGKRTMRKVARLLSPER